MHATRPFAARSTEATRTPIILAIILIAYFMILLDNSVIFTGLPSIQSSMGLSTTQLSWVQDAYTLTFGGLLLLAARAGDILGRRKVFVTGLVLFTVASAMVGAAPSGGLLIGARAIQGVGAAIVAPTTLSLLTATFPEGPERHRAVAWYGATAGIGASLGLVLGGALAHWFSWRAGFYVNVPVGLLMVAATLRYIDETPRRRGRFDHLGAIAATAGVGALVFGIIEASDRGWDSIVVRTSIGLGILMLVLLVVNEARAEQPIMPLRLFADRERLGGYLSRLFFLGAMIGFFYFTTQYLQGVLGWTSLEAGLGFLPMTIVNFVVALCVPRVVRRHGNGAVLVAGIAVTLTGLAWLSRLGDGGYLVAVGLPMLVIGAGQGLAFAPMTSAGIARVTGDDAGAASGIVNTFHQLGSALGLAILVTVSAGAGDGAATATDALAASVRAALTGSTVLMGLALIAAIALVLPARRAPTTTTRSLATID